MMNILEFDAWRENAIKDLPAKTKVSCPDCSGIGVKICSCCDGEKDCDLCDGDGSVEFGELDESEKRSAITMQMYHEALYSDLMALASWKAKNPVEIFNSCGLAPYTTRHGKKIQFSYVGGAA